MKLKKINRFSFQTFLPESFLLKRSQRKETLQEFKVFLIDLLCANLILKFLILLLKKSSQTFPNFLFVITNFFSYLHREFYYQQIDKYARTELSNGRVNGEEIHVPADSELLKVLNVHYNRQNHISVSIRF